MVNEYQRVDGLMNERNELDPHSIDALLNHEFVAIGILRGLPPRVVLANRASEMIIGYSSSEFASFTDIVEAVVHPDDREKILLQISELYMGEKKIGRAEIRVIHKNGETRWIDITTSQSIHNEEQDVLVIFMDITEKRIVEKALRKSEEKYR